MGGSDIASSCLVLRSRRPQTRLEASCTRTGRPRRRLLPTSSRTAGEGLGRKARMNVAEESDSGVLPMNHSNKIEQSMAESEEGRPLIKENIHICCARLLHKLTLAMLNDWTTSCRSAGSAPHDTAGRLLEDDRQKSNLCLRQLLVRSGTTVWCTRERISTDNRLR